MYFPGPDVNEDIHFALNLPMKSAEPILVCS